MGKWAESKVVTRKSWAVIKDNKYLLGFPLVGFVLSLIPLAIFWIPAAFFLVADQNIPGIIFVVLGFFGVSSVVTFTTAGLVAAADEELAGRDASLGYGMKAAFGRFGVLLKWSIIQTVVGILIGLVRGDGQGSIVGVILRNVVAAMASVMWELITFFALPMIMLERVGPIEAIKRSASLFKQRWGTQLAGGVRIGGLIFLVAVLPSIVFIVFGVISTLNGLVAAGIPLMVIGVIIWSIAALFASAMRGIFSVALYRYATDGVAEGGFTEQELRGAVRIKA